MYELQMDVMEEERSTVDGMMNQKTLGEPGYSVNDVVNTLLGVKDQSRLETGLAKLMIKLRTDDFMKHDISQRLLIGLLQPCEALSDVLLEWKSRAPEEASIKNLINVLSEAELNDFANALANRFECLMEGVKIGSKDCKLYSLVHCLVTDGGKISHEDMLGIMLRLNFPHDGKYATYLRLGTLGTPEALYSVLADWKTRCPENCTVTKLSAVLQRVGLYGHAKIIEDKFCDKQNSGGLVLEQHNKDTQSKDLIGDPGYRIHDVVAAILNNSCADRLSAKIFELALYLRTTSYLRCDIRNAFAIFKTMELNDVLTKLLEDWRFRLPEEATVSRLIEVFRNLDLFDIADNLEKTFDQHDPIKPSNDEMHSTLYETDKDSTSEQPIRDSADLSAFTDLLKLHEDNLELPNEPEIELIAFNNQLGNPRYPPERNPMLLLYKNPLKCFKSCLFPLRIILWSTLIILVCVGTYQIIFLRSPDKSTPDFTQHATTPHTTKNLTTELLLNNLVNISVSTFEEYQTIFCYEPEIKIEQLHVSSRSLLDWSNAKNLCKIYHVRELKIEGIIPLETLFLILGQLYKLETLTFSNNKQQLCKSIEGVFYKQSNAFVYPNLISLVLKGFHKCDHFLDIVATLFHFPNIKEFIFEGNINDETVTPIQEVLRQSQVTIQNISMCGELTSGRNIFDLGRSHEVVLGNVKTLTVENSQSHLVQQLVSSDFCKMFEEIRSVNLSILIDLNQFKNLLHCPKLKDIVAQIYLDSDNQSVLNQFFNISKYPNTLSTVDLVFVTDDKVMHGPTFPELMDRSFWIHRLESFKICIGHCKNKEKRTCRFFDRFKG